MTPATLDLIASVRRAVRVLDEAYRDLSSADADTRAAAVARVDDARLALDLALVAVEVER